MRIFSTCLAIVIALTWCNGAMVSAAEQLVLSIEQSVNFGDDIRPQLNGSLGSDKPDIQAYEERDRYDENKTILMDHNSGGATAHYQRHIAGRTTQHYQKHSSGGVTPHSQRHSSGGTTPHSQKHSSGGVTLHSQRHSSGGVTPHSQRHSSGRATQTLLDYQSRGVIPSFQGHRFAEDTSYSSQHGRHSVMSPHHGNDEDTLYSPLHGNDEDTLYSPHHGNDEDTSYSSHHGYGEVILDNKGQNYGGASTQYQGQVYGADNYEGKYASGSIPNFYGQGYGGIVTDYKGQGQGYGETSFSSSNDSESTIHSHNVDDQTEYQIKQFGLHQLYAFGVTGQTGQTEITHSVEIGSVGHDNENTASGKTHFSIHSNYTFGSDEQTGSSFTDEDVAKVIEYCHQNHPNCTSEANDSNVTESCEIILNQLNVTVCAEEPGFINKIGIYFLNGINELKNFMNS